MSASPADTSRRLIRSCNRASLATTMADDGGAPYASLVMTACSQDASPLLFISDLAVHTKNLRANAECSLLFDGTRGLETPLTGARISVQGIAEQVEDERLLKRYCARHPSAAEYAGFADFHLFKINMTRIHLVAGFGKIHWIDADDVKFDTTDCEDLATAEGDIVSHMNAGHSDAIGLYANILLGQPGVGWHMTGVDPEGCDLALGAEIARLPFDRPVTNAEEARRELVKLAKQARSRSA